MGLFVHSELLSGYLSTINNNQGIKIGSAKLKASSNKLAVLVNINLSTITFVNPEILLMVYYQKIAFSLIKVLGISD